MIAGAGPDGASGTWAADVAAEVPAVQPRMEFVGAESLMALAADHSAKMKAAGIPPCPECTKLRNTIVAREYAIEDLKVKVGLLVERAEEEAKIQQVRTVTAEGDRNRETIARLEATERRMRRALDFAEARTAQLMAAWPLGREIPDERDMTWDGDHDVR